MSSGYRYACCVCCEYSTDDPDNHVNGHDEPCEAGCNDGEGAA